MDDRRVEPFADGARVDRNGGSIDVSGPQPKTNHETIGTVHACALCAALGVAHQDSQFILAL